MGKKILQETLDRDMRSQPWEYKSWDRQTLLGNIYGETSAPIQTAFAERDETINYFREHCNARGTHLIIHYPRNVGIMLIKMKGESHFHLLLRCTGLWRRLFGRQAEPGNRELSPGDWTSHLDQGWGNRRSGRQPLKEGPSGPCSPIIPTHQYLHFHHWKMFLCFRLMGCIIG